MIKNHGLFFCILCQEEYYVTITLNTGASICLNCTKEIKQLETFAPNPFQEAN
jgi:hypothetical protein